MICKTFSSVVLVLVSGAINVLLSQSVTAIIDRDVRVFTTMAALNAAGFDVELAPRYHPVREQVRAHLASLEPDLRTRLGKFYREHKGNESDEIQLAKYVSLALVLTYPPTMKFAYEEDLLPPDARELVGFLPLLQEFYIKAGVPQLWSRLSFQYEEYLDSMGPDLRKTILQTDAFLRVPLGSVRDRQLVIFVELAAPVNSVNVRNYQDNLYIVLGQSSNIPVDYVRHAYLHLLLDPLVRQYREDLKEIGILASLIKGVEGVRPQFTEDLAILATESLIRAAEIRMDRLDGIAASEQLDAAYRSGMLLVPFFHDEFKKFLSAEAGIREYFREMLEAIDFESEEARFDERFHQIEPPPAVEVRAEVPPAPTPPDPVRAILRAAQSAFNSGEDDAAHEAFQRILVEFDLTNGPAMYGMALIASRKGDSILAKDYFVRTIKSDTAEPSMIVWSHIFLGRIYDIECQREDALEQYGLAIRTGDDMQGAQAAARAGLETAFGGGC